MTRIKFEKEH